MLIRKIRKAEHKVSHISRDHIYSLIWGLCHVFLIKDYVELLYFVLSPQPCSHLLVLFASFVSPEKYVLINKVLLGHYCSIIYTLPVGIFFHFSFYLIFAAELSSCCWDSMILKQKKYIISGTWKKNICWNWNSDRLQSWVSTQGKWCSFCLLWSQHLCHRHQTLASSHGTCMPTF